MKQLLAGVVILSFASVALGDQTVNFRNNVLTTANTKVLFGENSAGFTVGNPVVNDLGKSFVAQLYQSTGGSLTAVGATANFRPVANVDATTTGTWSGANRTLVGSNIGDTVNLVVRAWDSSFASFEAAVAANGLSGQSAAFTFRNPGNVPAGTSDTFMVNFVGFSISQVTGPVIPEPSTIALAGLGVAGLLFLRRK
jgi:hypothetical protein